MGAQEDPARPQRLELPANPPTSPAHGDVGSPAPSVLGRDRGDDPAVVAVVSLLPVIPLRILRQPHQSRLVDHVGRQVEIELQLGRGRLAVLGDGDLIQIVGCLPGGLGVIVLDLAVDVQHLRPGQDLLEPVQHQRIVPLGLIELAAARGARTGINRLAIAAPVSVRAAPSLGLARGRKPAPKGDR